MKSPLSPLPASSPAGPPPTDASGTAEVPLLNDRAPTMARARNIARSLTARPELLALLLLAGLLNLWALSRNGWANDYYAAAVRSMSSSWHNFLFGSLDQSGVMTVDKPPLALWVQSLSVRLFGYHTLSLLVPQALEGVASVVLLYDLLRRRFGRLAGFIGGLALALTPITVAISRHNNPDALLVLCCVAALWFFARALEDGATRWIVLAGVAVGLGFETKMLVALVVVPGMVLAWLWVAPRGRLCAVRQLLAGGGALMLVGGAWPLLVELTPAADRPWISGTSDNKVLSLIFEYNGLGRVDGQAGGPGGRGGGNMFGGVPGPLRLLNSALGGQAGWLLGFALVSGVGILWASRMRRSDPRTGWLIAVGGSLLVTAVLFSEASGIFHPYYVSLLAPFVAALTGAGAAQLMHGALHTRIVGPASVIMGVVGELVVLHDYPGQMGWLAPVLIMLGILSGLALVVFSAPRIRTASIGVLLLALLVAPASWAVYTLGHATSGTFPEGGPSSALSDGPGGGFGATGPGGSAVGGRPPGAPGGAGVIGGAGRGVAPALFGPEGVQGGRPSSIGRSAGRSGAGPIGAPLGQGRSLTAILSYVRRHGGGTLAVSSQSSAASSIIEQHASVAGIGGFSGRESDVSIAWLAQEVKSGHIRWVLDEESTGSSHGFGMPADSRPGARAAMAAVSKACQPVTLSSSKSSSEGQLYDCYGDAAALLRAG